MILTCYLHRQILRDSETRGFQTAGYLCRPYTSIRYVHMPFLGGLQPFGDIGSRYIEILLSCSAHESQCIRLILRLVVDIDFYFPEHISIAGQHRARSSVVSVIKTIIDAFGRMGLALDGKTA